MRTNLYRESLSNLFYASAKNYMKSFPELSNIFIFSEKETIYSQQKTARGLQHNQRVIKPFMEEVGEKSKNLGIVATAFAPEAIDPKLYINPVFISLDELRFGRKNLVNSFDRMMAHHIISFPEKLSCNKSECAADVFASLMHIKRYGKDIKYFADISKKASLHLIVGDKNKYTALALLAAEELIKHVDIEKMPRKDIAWYALQLARNYSFDEDRINKIRTAFKPARNDLAKREMIKIKTLLKITKKHKKDGDITRFCEMLLNEYKTKSPDITPRTLKNINKTLGLMSEQSDFFVGEDKKSGKSKLQSIIKERNSLDKQLLKEKREKKTRPLKNGKFVI